MLQVRNRKLFERPLSTSSPANRIKSNSHQRQAKYSSQLGFCQVCGDKASIVNYGALSCLSCKTFFRRNGSHPQNVHLCLYNNSCRINKDTRRCCAACRLAKCFLTGMSSDFIRKEERKKTKQSSSESKINGFTMHDQMMSTLQLWTSNPSHNARSLLITYEQKRLSNVIHALEIYSATSKVRDIIQNTFALFFDSTFNVRNAIESISLIHTSMRSFIKSTPDFQILTVGEQCSLSKRNLTGIVCLYSAVVFRDADVIDNSQCIQSFTSIYGLEMTAALIRISKQLDFDLIIVTLVLLILAFSSNCSTVDIQQTMCKDSLLTGTHRLLGSQNMYVELLWKYMVYRYGYYKSSFRFAQLITVSLDLIKYSANAYMNNKTYHDLVNAFSQETEQLLITSQNEQIQLWGTI